MLNITFDIILVILILIILVRTYIAKHNIQ